ncbi:MAG: outer membrane lipoprotein-sorting protein [Acidobacteriia bacterium]|nr:outer membrane lipoprotein-sorting protein [Terriglobia bacterium]
MSRKTLVVGSFLALAVSFALGADVSSSAAKLTAEQVIEKNIAARGGLQAWRAVQTLSMSGKMEAGGNESPTRRAQGVRTGGVQLPKRSAEQAQLPFRLELKRTRKSRLELDFRGQTAIQVYDGTHGWKLRPFLNRHEVEPFTAEQMKVAAMQSDLDGPLMDYAAKGTKVELEGADKVEGSDTYRLKLTFKNGEVQHVWVDAKTFLETKLEGTPRRLDGKYHRVEIYPRDYRAVNGLVMPYVMETKVEGVSQTEKIEVEKFSVNAPVEDSRFAKLQ